MPENHFFRIDKLRCVGPGAIQRDDLRFEFAIFADRQQPDGNGQLKPPWAARTGVEVENPFAHVEVGHMRVAEEDGGKLPCRGVEVQRIQVMKHVDVAIRDEHNVGLGQFAAWALAVHVAANRGDRSDVGELFQNRDFADVAEVENAVYSGQRGGNFGAE